MINISKASTCCQALMRWSDVNIVGFKVYFLDNRACFLLNLFRNNLTYMTTVVEGTQVTNRQVALAKEMGANLSQPTGHAMRKVGYSEHTIKKAGTTINSVGFQSLMDKYIPQDKILKRHSELVATDNEAVALGAVKLAHQVRGNMDDHKQAGNIIQVNFEGAPKRFEMDGEIVDINTDHGV